MEYIIGSKEFPSDQSLIFNAGDKMIYSTSLVMMKKHPPSAHTGAVYLANIQELHDILMEEENIYRLLFIEKATDLGQDFVYSDEYVDGPTLTVVQKIAYKYIKNDMRTNHPDHYIVITDRNYIYTDEERRRMKLSRLFQELGSAATEGSLGARRRDELVAKIAEESRETGYKYPLHQWISDCLDWGGEIPLIAGELAKATIEDEIRESIILERLLGDAKRERLKDMPHI